MNVMFLPVFDRFTRNTSRSNNVIQLQHTKSYNKEPLNQLLIFLLIHLVYNSIELVCDLVILT